MRRSSEPEERAQFTVAELLARYGDPAPATGRRRRRAAEDDTGTVAQTTTQPVSSPYRAELGEPTLRSESTQQSLTRRTWAPAVDSSPVAAERARTTPPVTAGRAPLTGTGLPDGPVTDQLPRLDPLPMNPAPWSTRRPINGQPVGAPIGARSVSTPAVSPSTVGPSTVSRPPVSTQRAAAEPPAGLGTATRGVPEQAGHVTADYETEPAKSGSPLWEWAAMVSQIGIGIVGGATLWLVCEWLWQNIPVVALVVALAVITGLVWIVRRVRRAEDLQTTVVAVLVGLFVTVSPAALLLVGR